MRRTLVFGATSTIAAEVAQIHARRGHHLHLIGRTASKLAGVAARCEEAARVAGVTARVTTATADLADLHASEGLVARALATLGGVDDVLVAHGDLGDQLASERSFRDAEATLNVNFLSAVSLLVPLANHCESARAGRIGVITSVAGDRGRPRNYTYGAAKGALTIYLQGVRSRLYASGVSITTLKLGPVDTPMTSSHRKNPLFGEPARVAQGIVRAMDDGVAEAYVPAVWAVIMPVVQALPEPIFQKLPFLSGR